MQTILLLKGRSQHAWDRYYLAFVKARLKEGILEAARPTHPGAARHRHRFLPANINRRARDADGKISLGDP